MAKKSINTEKELIDFLISGNVTPEEVVQSEKVLEEFGKVVDELETMTTGYILMSIGIDKKKRAILLMVEPKTYYKYTIVTIDLPVAFDEPFSFKIEEINKEYNLVAELTKIKEKCKRGHMIPEELMIVETFSGYKLNIQRLRELSAIFNSADDSAKTITGKELEDPTVVEFKAISDQYDAKVIATLELNNKRINKFVEELKIGSNLKSNVKFEDIKQATEFNLATPILNYAVIDKVLKINDTRYAIITKYAKFKDRITKMTEIVIKDPTDISREFTAYPKHYVIDSYRFDFDRVPYNLLDEGRVFLGPTNNSATVTKMFAGMDPRLKEYDKDAVTEALLDDVVARGGTVTATEAFIQDKDNKKLVQNLNLSRYSRASSVTIQEYLKYIKIMSEEYLYMVKNIKSSGSDVKITENISFDFVNSILKYNDFSLKIEDEQIKQRVYEQSSDASIIYFRGEKNEQETMDSILYDFYTAVKDKVMWSRTAEWECKFTFNNCTPISISKKGNLTYINGQRYNKNEIINVIKEVSCFRDGPAAAKFIETIGRLGLSVYIGVTTGYQIKDRLYRFKKLKGRSNYNMYVNDAVINIQGKQMLNKLYEACFTFKNGSPNQIDKLVYDSVASKSDYIKYKLLIDKSLEEFTKKSKEFLEQRVKETESQFTEYMDVHRNTVLEGIFVTGISGNTYVICYDKKNSYVFMNPTKTSEGKYTEGKYICMIDQSAIKSTISYDTVISKILALRNDSVMTNNIYNLKDELEGE